jgi:hypothetical protein
LPPQEEFAFVSLAGIAHVGGGADLADARKPVIVERNGIKLGFLGSPNSTISASPRSRPMAGPASSRWIRS